MVAGSGRVGIVRSIQNSRIPASCEERAENCPVASASGAFQQVGGEGSDVLFAGVPGAHQTAATFTNEVVEEPPKIKEIVDKKLGAETIKGDPDAELSVEPVGNGDVVEEDNSIYNTAGIEVKPDFPGGMEKFYKFVGKNYQVPEEEGLKGKVFVSFVVEKDGSLTDIKVIRDIGYGTGKEAIRVLRSCPKWNPGEQNGKKVRVLYSLPINIQSAE